jgi:rod shape-determining protein MreD
MLKTIITFFILSVFGVYLQSSLFSKLFTNPIAPDFILILVVWVSLFKEAKIALLGSFFLGLLSDFSSALYLGPPAAAAVVSCMFVQGVSKHVYAERFLSISFLSFFVSILKQLSARLIVLSFIGFQAIYDVSFYVLFGQAFLTAIFAPLIIQFFLLSKKKKVRH